MDGGKTTIIVLCEPVALIGWAMLFSMFFVARAQTWRKAAVIISPALIVYIALSSPLGANSLVRPLEQRANAPSSQCERPDAHSLIVLLSGGIRGTATDDTDIGSVHLASFRRTSTAVEHAMRLPGSYLLISGGGYSKIKEAAVLSTLAQRLGMPAQRISLESKSQTTYESAVESKHLAETLGADRVDLVTSAMHMPRALAAFSEAGINACPVPTDFQHVEVEFPEALLPQISALTKSTLAIHEYLGWLLYSLSGRA